MTRFLTGLAGALSGLLLLLSAGPADAQVRYVPTEESRVWIEGTSNATDFTCTTRRIEGEARLPDESDTAFAALEIGSAVPNEPGEPELQATVPVETLDCGKRRQNRDLYEAMAADEHPTIRYELLGVEVIAEPDSADGEYMLRAEGELTIAGVTQTAMLDLQGRRLNDGKVRAQGSTPMKMTDFDIDPPTALLGLIRVRDDIEVHFDITAVPAEDREQP